MLDYFRNDEEVREMDSIEAEVDAIRQKIWERTKNMTPEERIADLIKRTDPLIQQFHIKVSDLKPAKLRYTPALREDYASL